MKKQSSLPLVGTICLAMMLVGLPIMGVCATKEAPTPIKLVIANWEGPKGMQAKTIQAWAKELEERSGGRIKTNLVYGGAMGKAPEHYDLAVNGICNVAQVAPAFTPGKFPMAEVMEMPINSGQTTNEMLSMAFLELYNKGYFDKDFKDVVMLTFGTSSPYNYQMTKDAVLTFEDMKGKKMRATGKAHSSMVKAFGSIPIGMPGSEIYTALDKGIVDGTLASEVTMSVFRYENLIKHITETGISSLSLVYVMNKATYQRLPKDIQKMIVDMRPKYSRFSGRQGDIDRKAGTKLALEAGAQIHQFSKADTEKLSNALSPTWKNWIAEGKAKGLPREKMLKDFWNILRDMGLEKPFRGYTP